MEKIIWSDEYCIGIKAIDDQHQILCGLLNKYLVNKHLFVDSEAITDALNEIAEFAKEHFAQEEKLMKENGFPDFVEHKAEHKAYIDTIEDLCFVAMNHRTDFSDGLLKLLYELTTQHMLKEVKEFRLFFNENGMT